MRAAIFIDGGYLISQLKNERATISYEKFADKLLTPLRGLVPIDLLRCYFYYCAPWMSAEPTEDELRRMDAHNVLVTMIESISRWQVRLGKLERRWDGQKEYFEQKRVDVLLSCDLVRHAAAGHIQHAILVAGDSDFIPAVSAAKESGVTVSLWHGPGNTVHKDLITLCDEAHELALRSLNPGMPPNEDTPTDIRRRQPKPQPPKAQPQPQPAPRPAPPPKAQPAPKPEPPKPEQPAQKPQQPRSRRRRKVNSQKANSQKS